MFPGRLLALVLDCRLSPYIDAFKEWICYVFISEVKGFLVFVGISVTLFLAPL